MNNVVDYQYGINPYDVEYLPSFIFGKVDKEYL